MTEESRSGSLAEQAAAWVPPWARTAEPAATADAEMGDETDAAPDAGTAADPDAVETPPEVAARPEPEVVAEPEPATAPEVVDEPGLGEGELRAALEAILMVVDEPATEEMLAQVLDQPAARVGVALAALSEEYTRAGRGFDLRRAAGGWRFYTRADQAAYVERFVLDGQQARLTQAALETLAVVAYRQPVTRSRISAIRGVNSDGVIRTLLSRGLVEEAGAEPDSGAYLYRTSTVFLEKLGLDSLEQLPPLAPFLPDDVDALNPDDGGGHGG